MKKLKENPEKTLYFALLIIFILSMIPVWYLGRYAVPSLDDYYFGQRPHQAWLATHSLKEVLKGACDMVSFYYFAKQATFSSIFLMALFPGVLNEKWYFLTPLIMTGMLTGSVSVLVHTVIGDCMGIKNRYLTGIVNLLILFLSIQTMLVPLEGIYWYNGALHYVFMQSVLFFEVSCILHFLNTDKKKTKIWTLATASVLGIIVGGGNLITGLQACILVGLFVIISISQYAADKKTTGLMHKLGFCRFSAKKLQVLIPGMITVIAYMVNVLAPGNAKREGIEVQMNPVKAVIESFYWGAVHGISWITPMMIVVFAVIAVIIWKMAEDIRRRFINPLLMFIVSYCVFAAMLTPTWYATSMDAPDRVKNIICLTENILIFINIVNACGWCRMRKNEEKTVVSRMLMQTEGHTAPVILVGILLVMAIFLLPENKNEYTSLSAVRSILTGDAARYYDQSWERIEIYNDDTQSDVTVHKLTDDAKPYLLFKEDISDEADTEGYWQSVEIADYYGKTSITVVD